MSSVSLSMHNVFKKFRKGERHDSLRDLIPALLKRSISRSDAAALRQQEFWALNDVSFEIQRGEAVGFLGHNGAGKSTLLKLLSGIMRPTLGELRVNGRLSALIEVGAGFHHDLTGRENIFMNGVILGMTRNEVRKKFDEIVEFSGLSEFIDTPVKRYSSGMYARLGFSVAVHLEPEILVVDEVLSVGDQVFQQKSLEKMRSILHGGSTVIFVSHNLRAVSDLCSRAIMLRQGSVIDDGPTSRVIHTYLEYIRSAKSSSTDKDAVIESAVVRGRDGPRYDFASGEHAWLDVTFRAVRPVKQVVCAAYVLDSEDNLIFKVSSEALGRTPYDLAAGDREHCTFALDLHFPAGNFQLCVMLCEVDDMRPIEWVQPVATLLMRSDTAIEGCVNLYPQLEAPVAAPAQRARAS